MGLQAHVMKELPEYLYEFDINGYVIMPGVICEGDIQLLLDYWSANLTEHPVRDVNFDWGDAWRRMAPAHRSRPGIQFPLRNI